MLTVCVNAILKLCIFSRCESALFFASVFFTNFHANIFFRLFRLLRAAFASTQPGSGSQSDKALLEPGGKQAREHKCFNRRYLRQRLDPVGCFDHSPHRNTETAETAVTGAKAIA